MNNDIRERLQETAEAVAVRLPPHTGFIVLAFDLGASGRVEYISNANRQDCLKLMVEFVVKQVKPEFWMKHCQELGLDPKDFKLPPIHD